MGIRHIAVVFLSSIWSKQWMVRFFSRLSSLRPYQGFFWVEQYVWSIVPGRNALCSWHTKVVLSCDKLALIEKFLCCQSVNGGSHFWLFALLGLIYLCFSTVLSKLTNSSSNFLDVIVGRAVNADISAIFWTSIEKVTKTRTCLRWCLPKKMSRNIFFLNLENMMIFVFLHELRKIWWFLSFGMKLEKFDDFCLLAFSWKNLMIFIFFHEIWKIGWFLSFFMK